MKVGSSLGSVEMRCLYSSECILRISDWSLWSASAAVVYYNLSSKSFKVWKSHDWSLQSTLGVVSYISRWIDWSKSGELVFEFCYPLKFLILHESITISLLSRELRYYYNYSELLASVSFYFSSFSTVLLSCSMACCEHYYALSASFWLPSSLNVILSVLSSNSIGWWVGCMGFGAPVDCSMRLMLSSSIAGNLTMPSLSSWWLLLSYYRYKRP